MNTIELIRDVVLFGGTLPKNRTKEVRTFLDEQEKAITVTRCCTELKVKENLNFKDWKKLNKYKRTMHGYYKQGDKLVKSMDVVLMYKDYQDTI